MYLFQKNSFSFFLSRQLLKATNNTRLFRPEIAGIKKFCRKTGSVLLIIQLLISTLFGYGNYLPHSHSAEVAFYQNVITLHSSPLEETGTLSNELTHDLEKIVMALIEDGEETEEKLKKRLRLLFVPVSSLFRYSAYWIDFAIYPWLHNWVVPLSSLPCYLRYCSLKIPS